MDKHERFIKGFIPWAEGCIIINKTLAFRIHGGEFRYSILKMYENSAIEANKIIKRMINESAKNS